MIAVGPRAVLNVVLTTTVHVGVAAVVVVAIAVGPRVVLSVVQVMEVYVGGIVVDVVVRQPHPHHLAHHHHHLHPLMVHIA